MALSLSSTFLPSAYLVNENRIFQTFTAQHPNPESPWTPVTALVEGIWAIDPSQARKILRQPIVTRFPMTPLCEGMVKVAAKRFKVFDEEEFTRRWSETENCETVDIEPLLKSYSIESHIQSISSDAAMKLALELSKKSHHSDQLHESDREVGAVLVSKEGKCLATAWNSNASNRTHHAELKLVQDYLFKHKALIPEEASLYVTLQPCAMCAAQLFTFTKRPESLKILYLQEDTGPLSKNSVLCPGSDLWRKAGSPKLNSSRF